MLPYFLCPACNRKSTWKPALAGKRARCGCGSVIEVPAFATDVGVGAAPAPRATSLAVLAVLGGSMAAGIAFEGPMWQNILKLCAVALLPLPIGSMTGRAVGGINGDIVSALISIGLYFAAFWAVFKMAWSDRTVCVLLIWIIRSGVAYAIFKLTGAMHGYSI
jgi:hypothetical protein